MKSQGVGGCAEAAGLSQAARGAKARQIQRLAASILRRIRQDPGSLVYMVRTYINNENFSTIRPELVREIVTQAEQKGLPWELQRELIERLGAQMVLGQRSISLVGELST